jgi:hypothetical protein
MLSPYIFTKMTTLVNFNCFEFFIHLICLAVLKGAIFRIAALKSIPYTMSVEPDAKGVMQMTGIFPEIFSALQVRTILLEQYCIGPKIPFSCLNLIS